MKEITEASASVRLLLATALDSNSREQTATERSTIMTVTLKPTISNAGVKEAVIIVDYIY